jgi:glycosyltransferase involved in cell wall biosynthesis
MPLVTVAISTWNRAHLVGRALGSALAQTFEDIEVLVVDDGSTDGTPAVLAAVDDGRVRSVRHARNHGVSRARNTAIGLARGRWLAYLDDDNEWAPHYLARQLALAAAHPEAGVVYCRARLRDAASGAERCGPRLRHGRVFRRLVGGWNPFVSGALIHTSTLREVGGLDERLRSTEDHDLWMRLAQRTEFAGNPDVLLTRHVRHGPQLSGNPELMASDVAVLDAKWRATITATCGHVARRRWQLWLLAWAERCRVEGAIRAGAGARVPAVRGAARLCRFLPWSAPHVAAALAVSVLGAPGLACWYGARRALGIPAIG